MPEREFEKIPSIEKEQEELATSYILFVRHAPRYAGKNIVKDQEGKEIVVEDPTDITSEGKQTALEIGASLKDLNPDLVKSFGSEERRTIETGEFVTEGSKVTSKLTGKPAKARPRPGFEYKSVLQGIDPEITKKTKKIINEQLSSEFIKMDQETRAKVREQAQAKGFEYMFSQKEVVESLSQSMAYRLKKTLDMLRRGIDKGDRVITPLVGHGMFFEALCKKALVRQLPDGSKKTGFDDISEIGGFLKPGEIFEMKMERLGRIEKYRDQRGKVATTDPGGEKLYFKFSHPQRLEGEKYYFDMQVVEKLAQEFEEKIKANKK